MLNWGRNISIYLGSLHSVGLSVKKTAVRQECSREPQSLHCTHSPSHEGQSKVLYVDTGGSKWEIGSSRTSSPAGGRRRVDAQKLRGLK